MESQQRIKLAIAGAGNVATHLARGFHRAGCDIVSVSSRGNFSAIALADELGSKAVALSEIDTDDVDFVVIAVSDSAVAAVASAIKPGRAIILHTSGSVPLSALNHARCGVLYPLQTFSRDVDVDLSQVPFFTEAQGADVLPRIDSLAKLLSQNVYHADSTKRKALHVAGVLTSNFPIYLLDMAQRALAREGFGLEVVKPLVEATIAKAFRVGPHDAMTGPARRGDEAVVKAHEAWLTDKSDKEIYHIISDAILNSYHRE